LLRKGTDATIAEHIAKIIEREYVMEQQEGRTKYLVPSTLGIGLVEGYNQIGFDRSLSKPHLRREVSLPSGSIQCTSADA
jgi:DNA topoisomerase-3